MSTNHNEGNDEDKKSKKRLVRILVIIGIGIPVLVELMTLFNLINVQFTDDENNHQAVTQQVQEEVVSEGDTLFKKSAVPVRLEQTRILVSAQDWKFELKLTPADSSQTMPDINVDSLKLKSGTVLKTDADEAWISDRESSKTITGTWELPSGDIPVLLFTNVSESVTPDSTNILRREVRLDNIPVRYSRN